MKKSRHAFTLIELLVVVAIIALLISILMPSLSRARKQAKTVLCQSNLRQIGIGLFMYAEQHKGRTLDVWPYRNHNPPPPLAPFLWDYSYHCKLLRYVGNNKQVYFCPDRPEQSHVTVGDPLYGTTSGVATTYAYNETGWSDAASSSEGWLSDGRPLASIKRPFEKIWVGEASNISPNDIDGWQLSYSTDGFNGPNPPPYQKLTWKDIYNAPGCEFDYEFLEPIRHGKGNVCLYYDGRAEVVVTTLGRNWRARF